jgi:integrase
VAGSKWQDGDFVFTTRLGASLRPNHISHIFPGILKAAGLPPVRFHDLRHSCATLLLFLGVHPKLVQETTRTLQLPTHDGHLFPHDPGAAKRGG